VLVSVYQSVFRHFGVFRTFITISEFFFFVEMLLIFVIVVYITVVFGRRKIIFPKNHFSWKMFIQGKFIFMSFFIVWYKINNFSMKKEKISTELFTGKKID